ncbi:hypothetical protein KBD34_01310 [Patescibacteria group bacterium]|nr:hypothetical protein [Patescibacteria group bacterium]
MENLVSPEQQKESLTTEEKFAIDKAIWAMRRVQMENGSAAQSIDFPSLQRVIGVFYSLAEGFGAKCLFYLRELVAAQKLSISDYAQVHAALGTSSPDDIDPVLTILAGERIHKNSSEIALAFLLKYLARVVIEIKAGTQWDDRLQVIQDTLFDQPALFSVKNKTVLVDLAQVLRALGTLQSAAVLREKIHPLAQKLGMLGNLQAIQRLPLRAEQWALLTSERVATAQGVALDSPLSPKASSLIEEGAFREFLEQRALCSRAREMVEGLPSVPSTAQPALRLQIYAAMREEVAGGSVDWKQVQSSCKRLLQHEAQYARTDLHLPTIGIEVEIPSIFFTFRHREVLLELGIPTSREDARLNEMSPEFSHSPWIQASLLQGLVRMGAVPSVATSVGGLVRVANDVPFSLHVNLGIPFGVPEALDKLEKMREEIAYLNDALTYAFASPERALFRKTDVAFSLKHDAERSNKMSNKTQAARLELRAGEFRGFPTYRLLAETQCLGSMFFAYQQQILMGKLPDRKKRLAELWPSFRREVTDLMHRFSLGRNVIDHRKDWVAQQLRDTDVSQVARRIVDSYARKAHRIAFSPHSSAKRRTKK